MSNLVSGMLNIGAMQRQVFYRQQSSDEDVLNQIFGEHQYDLQKLARGSELIAYAKAGHGGRKPLVIDAGANIGASPLYFAATLPYARVIAIEPDRANFDLLVKNVEGLDVEPLHAALASKPGRSRVTDPGQGHWAYRTEPAAEDAADSVPQTTINSIYAAQAEQCFPFLVKIDIEGAEKDVFSGDTSWIAQTPLLIIELHDWLLPKRGTARPFLQSIAPLDRDFIYVGEDVFSIANDIAI